MVIVSVLYPAGDGATFDMEYYRTTHREIVERVLSPARFEIEQGLDGQPFVAMGRLVYDSQEAMGAAMASPDAGEAMADIPNFTNISAQMQISTSVD